MSQHEPFLERRLARRSLFSSGAGLTAGAVLSGCALRPPQPPAPTSTPVPAPGTTYVAADGYLHAPDGSIFVPVGANVGTTGSFDWKGDSQGHAADAVAWGWNTVRLNLMVTGAYDWSYVAQNSIDALLHLTSKIVAEYTAAGIVVVLDAHDNPKAKGVDADAVQAGMVTWWKVAAAAFKDNPRVWSGLINEPEYTNDAWVGIIDSLAQAVRATGNENPILVGAPCWGQDVGYTKPYFADAKFAYEPTMAPVINQRYGNVVLEQHNYGAYDLYSTAEKLTGYVNNVRAAGLAPLIGEFGFTTSQSQSPAVYQVNRAAAEAVFQVVEPLKVGALWWHASHGDNYSLKSNGSAFWNGGSDAGLSDGGQQLWALTHGSK